MEEPIRENQKNGPIALSIFFAVFLIAGSLIYSAGLKSKGGNLKNKGDALGITGSSEISLEEKIMPEAGVVLPIKWGDLGKRLVQSGVIDSKKMETLQLTRGGLSQEEKNLLYGDDNGNIIINRENASFLLNLFWALGLGNKNAILEQGPMTDSRYGGAGNFASTGGWTLGEGSAMNHYSKHEFIVLGPEKQALVERISKNIYRPCCDNSTYFPDCNHGMAMLGLLELMASQGTSEDRMYRIALLVNSYWFPDTYLTIGQYLKNQGRLWESADAREILGPNFSSGSGYGRILAQMTPKDIQGGGGCGV